MNNYASTADFSVILDEREKRLNLKEELMNCKEQMLALQRQNDSLKREIVQEHSINRNSYAMSNIDLKYLEKAENINRESQAI